MLTVLQRRMQSEEGIGVPRAERAAVVGVARLQQYRMPLRSGGQRREPAHAELRTRVFDAANPIRIDVDPGFEVGQHGIDFPAVPELTSDHEELLGPHIAVGVIEKSPAPEIFTGEGVRRGDHVPSGSAAG
jgi:hypothetical protein